MEQNNNPEVIDLREIFKKIWKRKKLFLKTLSITFVLSCLWILPQPRSYVCSVSLAPESSNAVEGGSLSSLASSFGINLGGMASNDAFYPLLYPDVIQSTDFVLNLFDVKVKNADGDIETDYYTYLTQYQQKNLLTEPFKWCVREIKKMLVSQPKDLTGEGESESRFNSFCLNEEQTATLETVRNNISCDVDIKTEVITITVQDQDRLICAALADSVRERLQQYIIQYRTSKARHDLEYYESLRDEAKADYEKAVDAYSAYCDSHNNMILQSYISERDALENEMQIKYQAYTAFNTQLQAASAKVQESTPAFTILQCASVPLKPVKPKRILFVLGMMFLSCIITSAYLLKDDIFYSKR